MKKILHLLASNKFSGAENVVCTIIENFNNEFDIAYCSPYGPIEETLKSKEIKYYGIKKFNQKNLKNVIKKFQPDIIHAHDYRASILAAFSGFNGKIISHLHNNCPFAKKWNIKTMIYNISLSKYSKVIGVSDKVYEEAIFKNNLKNKYITIYNYVDKEKIIDLSKKGDFSKKYDLFFIGRLSEQKNPFMFIEIVKSIKKIKNDITAVIIGDGELKKICLDKIKNYNLNTNIDMIGFVDNPFTIINNCKIGIMPSKWEGFGLTAIESLILNKPVLNSGVGGLGEIFKNNKELICTNNEEYIKNIENLINEKLEVNFTKIISKFTNKNYWINSIKLVYGGIDGKNDKL